VVLLIHDFLRSGEVIVGGFLFHCRMSYAVGSVGVFQPDYFLHMYEYCK
jgi:hypothetical protein